MPARLVNRECSLAAAARCQRYCPEQPLLHQLIERDYPVFLNTSQAQGHALPQQVPQEFEDYLKRGHLEYGFPRVRCEACNAEKLVAFSCKRRGFCPGCGAKRIVESAAWLMDECYLICLCASGCSAFSILCDCCLLASPASWVRYWASCTARLPAISSGKPN